MKKVGNKQQADNSAYINLSTSQIQDKLSYRRSSLFNEKFRGGVFSFASKFQNELGSV